MPRRGGKLQGQGPARDGKVRINEWIVSLLPDAPRTRADMWALVLESVRCRRALKTPRATENSRFW